MQTSQQQRNEKLQGRLSAILPRVGKHTHYQQRGRGHAMIRCVNTHTLDRVRSGGKRKQDFIIFARLKDEAFPHFQDFTIFVALLAFVNTGCKKSSTCMCYNLLSSRSMRSRLSCASSASFADVFTPSPDFCVFSMMAHARSTKAGTVSCFSCFGISTSVQYCVSKRITS